MKNKNILRKAFSNNLKKYRKEKQLSQALLAEKSDLSPGYIGDIETGKSMPSFITIEKICQALNIPPYLLFITEEEEKLNSLQVSVEQAESSLLKEIRKAMDNIRENLKV